MTDDYSNYPQSIAEIKSDAENDGTIWSPRDVLVNMLRLIDKGELDPDILILSYRLRDSKKTGFFQSTVDGFATVGVLHGAINDIVNNRG